MTRALLCVALCLTGCSGENTQIGADEPFRVHAPPKVSWTAQFVKGELPGAPPAPPVSPTAPAAGTDGGAAAAGPKLLEILAFATPRSVLQGQANASLAGAATLGTAAIGIKLDDVGTGYWVVPTEGPDVDNNQGWEALADFDRSIPPGNHNIRVVPIAEDGVAGRQFIKTPCVTGANTTLMDFNPCTNKTGAGTPEAVISLYWDTNVDLDLQVRTPTGHLITSKRPTSLSPNDAGVIPANTAYIDHDSNAACQLDGLREENLIFPNGNPPHGLYTIYANLFDACKQSSVRFTVTVYSARNGEDGGDRHLASYFTKNGELLDFQANGGTDALGLYVAQFKFR